MKFRNTCTAQVLVAFAVSTVKANSDNDYEFTRFVFERDLEVCTTVCVPTSSPTLAPTSPLPKDYSYTGSNTANNGIVRSIARPCGNVNTAAPNPDGSDVVFQFIAMGDTPYDGTNTACLVNGQVVEDCTVWDCRNPHPTFDIDNQCLYTGEDYDCYRDSIIPAMKNFSSAAAFAIHIGDMLKGDNGQSSTRCNQAALGARKDLFAQFETGTDGIDFLIIPGDNEWNECYEFDPNSNNDTHKDLWRSLFAENTSPFHDLIRNFPLSGAMPTLERQEDVPGSETHSPENFFFTDSGIAFFGLNEVDSSRASTWSEQDGLNEAWIRSKLTPSTCNTFKSIVIFSHRDFRNGIRDEIDAYFTACGATKPVLNVRGNTHPEVYCSNLLFDKFEIIEVVVEAFQAAPLMVTILEDPSDGKHYFHTQTTSDTTDGGGCATFI